MPPKSGRSRKHESAAAKEFDKQLELESLRGKWRELATDAGDLCSEAALSLFTKDELKEGIREYEAELAKRGDEKPEKSPVIKKKHALKVCYFNALKLRTTKVALQDQWLALSAVFATFDVILMSEVPAKTETFEERVQAFAGLLQLHTHDEAKQWSMVSSEPSGAMTLVEGEESIVKGNKEVHVAFVRAPVIIKRWRTWTHADGVRLDYAPLTVLVEDERFEDPDDRLFCITAVHLPPAARKAQRDLNLKKMLATYPTEAELRLETAFTSKGAKDARKARVTHVLVGDWNTYPGAADKDGVEHFGLTKTGWAMPLIGAKVATSAGRKNYDNFLVDAETEQRFTLTAEPLELSMPRIVNAKQEGVSDHDPIVLAIKEARSTK